MDKIYLAANADKTENSYPAKKKVAMMQPTFLPWIGYFELIAKADKFIFLDDFQFVYRSFQRRNQIFTSRDIVQTVCVPIDRKQNDLLPINRVSIKEHQNWRQKLWNKITVNYRKTKYFLEYQDVLQTCILQEYKNLADQNVSLIMTIASLIGLNPITEYSSNLLLDGKRSMRNKNILEAVNADIYLSAHGSFDYMLEDGVFPLDNIEVLFQNAELEPYPQIGSTKGFVPYLSVIDALFNVGAEKTRELVEHTTKHWLTWNEMVEICNQNKTEGQGGNNEF